MAAPRLGPAVVTGLDVELPLEVAVLVELVSMELLPGFTVVVMLPLVIAGVLTITTAGLLELTLFVGVVMEEFFPVVGVMEELPPAVGVMEELPPVVGVMEELSHVVGVLDELPPIVGVLDKLPPVVGVVTLASPTTV